MIESTQTRTEMRDERNRDIERSNRDGDHDQRRPIWVSRGQAGIEACSEPDDAETRLVDTLTNLRHWAESLPIDFKKADALAEMHYAEEMKRTPETPCRGDGYRRQFNGDRPRQVLETLENLAWGDVDGDLKFVERALQLLLEGSAESFRRWEEGGDERFGADEFSLTDTQIEAMDDGWRLAYLARLIRSLGMVYGIATDYLGSDTPMRSDPHSIAGLLRELIKISEPDPS